MNQGPDVSVRLHAIADAKLLGLLHARRNKFFVDAALHITAFYRKAGLPGIDECAPNSTARCSIDVRVFQHDHRVLAAELEYERQESRRSRLCDPLPGDHTAREYQLIDGRL